MITISESADGGKYLYVLPGGWWGCLSELSMFYHYSLWGRRVAGNNDNFCFHICKIKYMFYYLYITKNYRPACTH